MYALNDFAGGPEERKQLIVHVPKLCGTGHQENILECEQRIADLIQETNAGAMLVLDFTLNEWMGSDLIAAIFRQWRKAKKFDIEFRTRGTHDMSENILSMSGMDQQWLPL